MKWFLLLFCVAGFCLTTASDALATHVRAGEITTRRISSPALTYEITLTVYFDSTRGSGRSGIRNCRFAIAAPDTAAPSGPTVPPFIF